MCEEKDFVVHLFYMIFIFYLGTIDFPILTCIYLNLVGNLSLDFNSKSLSIVNVTESLGLLFF